MKYKLIVFDMDGTLTAHVSSWQWLHERLGVWDSQAYKYQEHFLAGKISYRKFCELDAAHWKGVAVSEIENILQAIPYTKNVKGTLKKLKEKGFKTAILSTGLDLLAQKVKRDLGVDHCVANKLYEEKRILTGKVKIAVSDHGKGKVLERILHKLKVKPAETIFVGDGDSDIPAAKIAGYAIAFNSCSNELPCVCHYTCKTTDFYEVYHHILSLLSKHPHFEKVKRTNKLR